MLVRYTMRSLVLYDREIVDMLLLIEEVQVVSWSLPTTYGIVLLRDIFLRGAAPDRNLLGGLALIGFGLFLLAWFMLRRLLASR